MGRFDRVISNSLLLPSNYESLTVFCLLWIFSILIVPGTFIAIISGTVSGEFRILSLFGSLFVVSSAWFSGLNIVMDLNEKKNKTNEINRKCREQSFRLLIIFFVFLVFEIIYSLIVYTSIF